MPARRSRSPRRSPGRQHHQHRHRNSPPKRRHSSPVRCVERYDSVVRHDDEKDKAINTLLKDNLELKKSNHALRQSLASKEEKHDFDLRKIHQQHSQTEEDLQKLRKEVKQKTGRIEYLEYEWNKAVESVDGRKIDNRTLAVELATDHVEAVSRRFNISSSQDLLLSVMAGLRKPHAAAHDAGEPSSQDSVRDVSPDTLPISGQSMPREDVANPEAVAMPEAAGASVAAPSGGVPPAEPAAATQAAALAAPGGASVDAAGLGDAALGPGGAAPVPMQEDV